MAAEVLGKKTLPTVISYRSWNVNFNTAPIVHCVQFGFSQGIPNRSVCQEMVGVFSLPVVLLKLVDGHTCKMLVRGAVARQKQWDG